MKTGLHPISYFSQKTSLSVQYELEVLAVVQSVERYRDCLLGRRFMVDCEAAKKTMATKVVGKKEDE